ncbi:MAG: hypothetical protein RJA98_3521 [Pseudomonadota bacterium]|jgi:plastocyanin
MSTSRFAALLAPLTALSLLLAAPVVRADDDLTVALTLRNHQFEPAIVKVPAGQKVKLLVRNEDKTVEEFESKSLKREKLVPAGTTVTIVIGPLKPGRYSFFGEFHEATAKGEVVAE